MSTDAPLIEEKKRIIVVDPAPVSFLPALVFEAPGPTVFPTRQDIIPESAYVRAYVCVVCRQFRTLLRLRPEKIYACKECITEHGGKDMLLSRLRKVPE